MTFIEDPAVAVVDVAKRAGLTADELRSEAADLGLFVGVDWSGQEGFRPEMPIRW